MAIYEHHLELLTQALFRPKLCRRRSHSLKQLEQIRHLCNQLYFRGPDPSGFAWTSFGSRADIF